MIKIDLDNIFNLTVENIKETFEETSKKNHDHVVENVHFLGAAITEIDELVASEDSSLNVLTGYILCLFMTISYKEAYEKLLTMLEGECDEANLEKFHQLFYNLKNFYRKLH